MMIEWMCSVLVQQTEQCRRYIDQSQWDSAKLLNYSEENRRKETEMIKASSDHVVWVIVCRWLSGQLHTLHPSVLVSVCLVVCRQTVDRQTNTRRSTLLHIGVAIEEEKLDSSFFTSCRDRKRVLTCFGFVRHSEWLTLFLPYVCVCCAVRFLPFHSIHHWCSINFALSQQSSDFRPA